MSFFTVWLMDSREAKVLQFKSLYCSFVSHKLCITQRNIYGFRGMCYEQPVLDRKIPDMSAGFHVPTVWPCEYVNSKF